ncbi:MAG: UvrD-helicase domain-containing protein [Bacteroidales bacterium]|nr:UvrD-helicase domain-containing protein [Bacteroidales bacterium]MCF8333873.1 UvrD-helicase domain-containing protein [Bacteroidales bacterium]
MEEKKLLIYQSSAGSGKTTQIVREYFNLAIPNPSLYSSILAITFTNKAAGEMKNRIIEILKTITDAPSLDKKTGVYVEPLLKKGMEEAQIKKKADNLLNNILHDYSGFAVSTIDSLMHRIVRSFAFDLKLSSNFSVILDQKELVQQSVDLLLDNLGENKQLTDFLVKYLRENMAENRSWHIENSLYNFGMLLQDEEARKYIDKLRQIDFNSFVDIQQKLNAFTTTFEKDLKTLAEEGMKIIEDIPEEAFFHGKRGIPGYFKAILEEKYKQKGLSILYGNSYVVKFIEEGIHTSSSVTQQDKNLVDGVAQKIADVYHRIVNYTQKHGEKYFLFNLLKRNLHAMAVLREIENNLTQLKTEQDYVHISEFNRVIAEQIWKNGSVPFIYERIGEKYRHCFIDEFQDTSVLQWHNLVPLVTNGLASGAENMIVGDGKQSIYRFRSGEVEQFNVLPALYDKQAVPDGEVQEKTLKDHARQFVLEHNFRSSRNLVEFNNDFFDFVKNNTNQKIKEIYKDHHQKVNHTREGCVSVDFVEGTGEELKTANLEKVASIAENCLNLNYAQKDIAILCRKNFEGMSVARHLSEKGYDVISSDSLLLSSSPELHFITAILRYINNPGDQNAKAEIFSFLKNKDKWPKKEQTTHEGFTEATRKRKPEEKGELLSNLGIETDRINERSLYDLVEYIIRHFKLNEKPNPFVTFFLNEIRQLTVSGQTNLNDFLEWWEANKNSKSVVVPEGIDAIRVYTIHKAKGLQFPVVIYPFITKNYRLTKSNGWFKMGEEENLKDLPVVNLPMKSNLKETRFSEAYEEEDAKSLLDEINVNYVAFTRPETRLHVISQHPAKKPTNIDVPFLLKKFLEDKQLWKEDQSHYVFGNEKMPAEKEALIAEENSEHNLYLEDFISADWREKLVLAPEAPEKWDVTDPKQNRLWGNLIHRALAEVYTPEDIPHVVNSYVAKGLLEKEATESFRQTLEKVVLHEDLKSFFKPGIKVKNEAALINSDGKTLRPDKLIFEQGRVVLIEYKTGKPEDYHFKQIKTYRNALEEMGYSTIESYLLYLDEEIELRKV